MQFSQGQIVVYPHHGPATVTAITEREVKGVKTPYVVLSIHSSSLTVSAPVDNAELIGVRNVMDEAALDKLFELLGRPTDDEEVKWSRRFKNNAEKLKLGDIRSVAQVVRDLSRREDEKGLSLGERDMLRYAKMPLVTEIALSMGVEKEQAEAVLQSVLLPGARDNSSGPLEEQVKAAAA